MAPTAVPYATYDEVPYYRKQWYFWLWWFLFSPVAIGILLTGDVYYRNKGQVRSFGLANRIVAGVIAVIWFLAAIQQITGPYYPLFLVLLGYIGGGLVVLYLVVRVIRMAWRHGSQSENSNATKDAGTVGSTKNAP